MTAKNDITQDRIVSKPTTDKYRQNWDKVFGNDDNPNNEEPVDNDQRIVGGKIQTKDN